MIAAATPWTDIVRAVSAVIQVAAILVGGGWAFYKFVLGGTHKPRAELNLDAELLDSRGVRAISVNVAFHNLGARYIPFPSDEDSKLAPRHPPRVTVRAASGLEPGTETEWGPLLLVGHPFRNYRGCEVGESITDQLLLSVPASSDGKRTDILAYRLEAIVTSPKRKGEKNLRPWRVVTVVPAVLTKRAITKGGTDADSYASAGHTPAVAGGGGVRGR